MSKFSTTESCILMGQKMEPYLKECKNLEAAAQKYIDTIYEEYAESLVLLRMFVSVPYSALPQFNQQFVMDLATGKGIACELKNETPVLSLIGTRGREPEWNSWRQSTGHIGIPLVSTNFIDTIPMLSRLFSDLGLSLSWLTDSDSGLNIDARSDIAGTFFVENAKESTDSQGRKIIAMQDFVDAYDIYTVFGIGGQYKLGSHNIVAIIFFTNEKFNKTIAQRFPPLINLFKTFTIKHVLQQRIFSD
jgi:hypothetical protein